MNCQDNSRLKVPLPEMCKTTDIGCVPMTSGKPDCPPERDQIPLAYDINSQTLWIFSCESRQWVAMSKFQLAELQEVSLDNIRNICELLKIPVYYNPGGGTVQGSMPLADFGKELLKCQDMTPKAAVLGNGTVAFTIEGLESLSPLYVRYVNLEASGEGTQSNPLVVKAQDPLTRWPKRTEQDVDDAVQPLLAADLDGEMVRVPYPKKPCEYPRLSQREVESANEALIIGCVDSDNVKIPYPEQPKDYDTMTQDTVDGSTDRWLVAVVNGQQVRIPFPKGVCEYTRKTAEEISSQTTDIIACVNGEASQVPLSALKENINSADKWICDLPCATPEELESVEGFSIAICVGGVMRQMFIDCGGSGKKFPSIPVVCGEPSGPPAEGTPPLRVDCDNHLWVWDENSGIWIRIGGSTPPGADVPSFPSISGNIDNVCAGTLIRGYYLDRNEPTVYQPTKLTMSELAGALDGCGLASDQALNSVSNDVTNIRNDVNNLQTGLTNLTNTMNSFFTNGVSGTFFSFMMQTGGRQLPLVNIALTGYDNKFFVFAVHRLQVVDGSATVQPTYDGSVLNDPRNGLIEVVNPYDVPALIQVHPHVGISNAPIADLDYRINALCGITDDPTLTDVQSFSGPTYSSSSPTAFHAIVSGDSVIMGDVFWFGSEGQHNPRTSIYNNAPLPTYYTVGPREQKNLYFRCMVSIYGRTSGITIDKLTCGLSCGAQINIFPQG